MSIPVIKLFMRCDLPDAKKLGRTMILIRHDSYVASHSHSSVIDVVQFSVHIANAPKTLNFQAGMSFFDMAAIRSPHSQHSKTFMSQTLMPSTSVSRVFCCFKTLREGSQKS